MKDDLLKPQKGSILVSDPFMLDPNFKRTVLLLTEHNEKGSIGFVVNKPMNWKLSDIIGDFPKFNASVFYGGPVQPDTLHFIHQTGNLLKDSQKISEGIYWGGSFEALRTLVEQKQVSPDGFKFFIGYSGWSPHQLEDELQQKTWLVTQASLDYIFSDTPDKIWGKTLKQAGSKFAGLADFSESPSMN